METNIVYQGDCIEGMKKIPDNSIDLVLTDPPYGMTACEWDKPVDLEKWWVEIKRIIKPNTAVIITASQPFTTDLINSNRQMFKYELIWKKSNPSNISLSNIMPLKYHENILIFYEGRTIYNKQPTIRESAVMERHQRNKTKLKNYGTQHKTSKEMEIVNEDYNPFTKNPSSVLCIPSMRAISKEYFGHPTQKPVELFKYLIKTYSNENQVVLDCFGGSGTTAVACKQTNRKYILFETNTQYIEIINKRLAQSKVSDFTSKSKILTFSKAERDLICIKSNLNGGLPSEV